MPEEEFEYCLECEHFKCYGDDGWECTKSWDCKYDEEQECFECPDFSERKEPMSKYDYEDYIGAWKYD